MAASTIWWKNGDSEHVVPYKAKARALELCTDCGQAFEVHGKVGTTLVHPGDAIITHDGGDIEVVRPDPMAAL